MVKVHTRAKRKYGIAHSRSKIPTGIKKKGAKTFKTEEAAKKYAETKKIQNYSLINLKSSESKTKKVKIVINK